MDKNIGKSLKGKYCQKLHAKQTATDTFKTSSKRVIYKAAEPTGDLISNKTANRITKVSKNLQQNISKTVTKEHKRNNW